jgi:hypothetical protein
LNTFHDQQVHRLLKLYTNFSSDNLHNKDDLYLIFKNKFEAVFKLMSATDIYGFTKKLLCVFNIDKINIATPHKKCIDLIEKINSTAERFITIEMNKLINQPEYEQIVLDMEWPNNTIIKKCFYEYHTSHADFGNIVDIYNIDNEVKYSLMSIDKFPPVIKTKTAKKLKYESYRKAYESTKKKKMKKIDYISRNQLSF